MSKTKPPSDATSNPPYKAPQTILFRLLPSTVIPYAELMRLDRPAGFYAFYWHYAIGLAFAACLSVNTPTPISPISLLSKTAYLACWVVLRGTVCTINDNFDQDFDRQVLRTRHRPIARGAVSTNQAHAFAALQLVVGAVMVLPLGREASIYAAIITLVLSVYPLGKRITDFPQVILGFGLAAPVFLCCAVVGVDPLLQSDAQSWSDTVQDPSSQALLCLYLAGVLWTVIFDTIYAHQDIEDDRKAGVKGLAVRLGDLTKPICAILAVIQTCFLVRAGLLAGFLPPYFEVSCGGTALSLAAMLKIVDLKNPRSCAWWFGPGSRLVGASVTGGLVMEYCSGLFRSKSMAPKS